MESLICQVFDSGGDPECLWPTQTVRELGSHVSMGGQHIIHLVFVLVMNQFWSKGIVVTEIHWGGSGSDVDFSYFYDSPCFNLMATNFVSESSSPVWGHPVWRLYVCMFPL